MIPNLVLEKISINRHFPNVYVARSTEPAPTNGWHHEAAGGQFIDLTPVYAQD